MNDDDGHLAFEGGRIGAMQDFYYTMCEELYVEYVKREGAYDALPRRSDGSLEDPAFRDEAERSGRARDKLMSSAIKLIVLSCMCLEAAVYDYASWHLPARLVDRHLDRLNLYAKWLLVPRLVGQDSLAEDGAAMEALGKIIELRNMLVHSKSRRLPGSPEELHALMAKVGQSMEEVLRGGHQAMRAIILIAFELEHRLGDRTLHPFPVLTKNTVYPPKEFPPTMKPLLDRCRLIARKASARP